MVMNPYGSRICKKKYQIQRIEWYFLQQKHQDIPISKGFRKKSPNYYQNSKGFQNPNIQDMFQNPNITRYCIFLWTLLKIQ